MQEREETMAVDNAETSVKRECRFEKLTPYDGVDIPIYEQAISFALSEKDIRNVAISGAYGSGKSSVLASYEKKHEDKKFIHICLAHFGDEDQEKTPDQKVDAGAIIEGKIVNQLLHQIPTDKMPLTNFGVKKPERTKTVLIRTVCAVALITCLLHMLLSVEWIGFVGTFPPGLIGTLLTQTTKPFAFLLSGIVVFSICTACVWTIIKTQRYKSLLRKISFQGNEIEVFRDENHSFFDKYLNEVLYLFEQADVDAVVFEDIDRYKMEETFERLREVNTLVNCRLSKKTGKAIKFFFLLRDDLFASKDRTKFFDYIIPVVPVVDGSNSFNQLIRLIEGNDLKGLFDLDFLERLSWYIDDMRLLKNICNEFLIYYKCLAGTNLNYNRLLAVITYKNIFPKDFGDLQLKRGYVYAIVGNKDRIVRDEVAIMQDELEDTKSKIRALESELLQSLREVDVVFIDKYYKSNANAVLAYSDAQLKDWLEQRLRGERLEEYTRRRESVHEKLNEDIDQLRQKTQELQGRIDKCQQYKIAQIINRENAERIFSAVTENALGEKILYEEVKRDQYFNLLKFLILEGHIDETYSDYMTFFYPNSLTTTDKVFLQSVINKTALKPDYELKDPALVFKKLRTHDFGEKETLNFSLVSFILREATAKEHVNRLIDQLKESKNYEFISRFLSVTTERARFASCMNAQWPEFFSAVVKGNLLPTKQIWEFAHDILLYSPEEDINATNIDGVLTKYISTQADFLNIRFDDSRREKEIAQLVRGITLLGVKFHTIDYTKADHELFVKVYEQDGYEINRENVELMLKIIHCESNEYDLVHKNYMLIASKRNSAIYKYVESEIEKYVEIMLLSCQNRVEDNEHYVLEFLNHAAIQVEQKKQYIHRLCTKITTLEDVHDSSLWGEIINAEMLQPSENNILIYWLKFGSVDSMLTYYINCFDKHIDMGATVEACEKSQRVKLFEQVVESKDVQNDKYIQILASMNLSYQTNFGIKGVPDDKMRLLIERGIIWMTVESLKSIRANYSNVQYFFIEQNFEEYIKLMTPQLVVHEEVLEILLWQVSEEAKISLLKHAKTPISVVAKPYSTTIALYILENRLDVNDLPGLYTSYPKLDQKIRMFVVAYAASKVETVITGTIGSSDQLKLDLLASEKVIESNKYKLLLSMLPKVNKVIAQTCFSRMGLTEFSKIFDTHSRPKIPKTTQNQQILKVLQEREWIYDFPDYQYDDNYYTVRRNMPSKKKTLVKV